MCDEHDHDLPEHPAIIRPEDLGVTRRAALRRLGGAGLGAVALGSVGGLAVRETGAARTDAAYAASCTLTPELTEGPYYLDLRKNITEGRPGLRLDLRIRVINASTCKPIYPGWYQGRATHIHVMTYVGGRAGSTYSGGTEVHTGQFFFSDTTTDKVAKVAPYSQRGITRLRNSADGIYRQGGQGQTLALERRGSSIKSGFTGTITVAIDPS
jgi:hypothetical protein